MRNKLQELRRVGLETLGAGPGRDDAPFAVRFKRALPLMIPCVGIILLLAWNLGWQGPNIRAERSVFQPLITLESEIAQLQLANSEQQVVELRERAAVASKLLLQNSAALAPQLAQLVKEAVEFGWQANFEPVNVSTDPSPAAAQIQLLPVRAKLSPVAGNPLPFSSLLSVLESFSSSGKRIDLTRLTIRSDAQQWQAVELNLRLARAVTHEKTPE